ncbi:MAG: hypothetical protein JST00_19360 [Deltaproteobacteria bacterium]|nr:hypothetical protein [Deltaproteobacteria bacterium]
MRRLLGSFVALTGALLAAACGSTSDTPDGAETAPVVAESAVTGCDVHPERSLEIVDRRVLDDAAKTAPGGAFAFMTTLGTFFAPGFDARSFLGEQFAPGRVRHAWPLTPDGRLDVTRAPYRLLAVVLRPEGTWTSLGELRLVFEAWSDGALGELVSIEYGIDWRKPAPGEAANAGAPATGAAAAARRAAWVAKWRSLEDEAFASPAYVDALASLVGAVTRDPTQLRTIAIEKSQSGPNGGVKFSSLGRGGWQGLQETNLANTPPSTWNARGFTWNSGGSCGGWSGGACSVTDPLPRLVQSAENDLYAGRFTIPNELRTRDVIGTKASAWGNAFAVPSGWTPERWERARRAFSRSTCDGCHGADTGTTTIHHVISQPTGDAKLSPFVRDQELPQRVVAYRATLCGPTSLPPGITPVADGTAIEVGAPCTTEGAIVSEPCGGGASTNKRYAVCVRDGARLVVSERTSCIDDRRPECSGGERGPTGACGKCGTKQDYCFDFRWNAGLCSNQGVCEAGTTNETTAGCAAGSARTQTCSATCRWGDFGACTPR